MTAVKNASALAGVMRRQWWIVALCAVVAAGIGFALSSGVKPSYTASVEIAVDSSALTRFPGIPGPERLLKTTKSAEFRAAAARELGLDEAEVAAGLRTYTSGSPVEWFYVDFASEDKAAAKAAADSAADLVLAQMRTLGSAEIEKQKALLTDAQDAVAVLEKTEVDTGWERGDVAYKLWELRKELAVAESSLTMLDGCYVRSGAVQVSAVSVAKERASGTAGAALLGLLAGLALAAAREVWRRPGA